MNIESIEYLHPGDKLEVVRVRYEYMIAHDTWTQKFTDSIDIGGKKFKMLHRRYMMIHLLEKLN